jgi:hypothetical protein
MLILRVLPGPYVRSVLACTGPVAVRLQYVFGSHQVQVAQMPSSSRACTLDSETCRGFRLLLDVGPANFTARSAEPAFMVDGMDQVLNSDFDVEIVESWDG